MYMKRYKKRRRWIHKIAHTQQIDYIGTTYAIVCTAFKLILYRNCLVDGVAIGKIYNIIWTQVKYKKITQVMLGGIGIKKRHFDYPNLCAR